MMLMTLILMVEPTTTVTAGFSLSQGWLYALLGLVFLVMAGLLFTSYRYVLGYFLSGMGYWLMIEGLQWLVMSLSSLSLLSSYACAIGLSLIPMMVLLAKFDEVSASTAQVNLTRLLFNKFLNFSTRVSGWGKALFNRKNPPVLTPTIAGQRPLDIFKDTDYSQQFIQHSPVFDYEK